jgi:predicted RNase H-like nuclease (RuvC/YqgF family)
MAHMLQEQHPFKHESLNEENKRLEDTMEDLYNDKSKLIKDMKAMSEESEILKVRIGDVKNQKIEISNKFENLKRVKNKEYTEKCDMVEILESTLDNKKQELEKLQKELEIHNSYEYKCDICSFVCILKPNLEEHMEEKHYNIQTTSEDSEDVATTSKCGKCNYDSEEESELLMHI